MSIDIHSKQFKIILLALALILILTVGIYAFFISRDFDETNLPAAIKSDENNNKSKGKLNESISASENRVEPVEGKYIESISSKDGIIDEKKNVQNSSSETSMSDDVVKSISSENKK